MSYSKLTKQGLWSMQDYWKSLDPIDRCSLMESVHIDSEIGNFSYKDIPAHIRSMLCSLWRSNWSQATHELTF